MRDYDVVRALTRYGTLLSYMYSNHRVTATATRCCCSRTKDTAAAIIFVFIS